MTNIMFVSILMEQICIMFEPDLKVEIAVVLSMDPNTEIAYNIFIYRVSQGDLYTCDISF